MYPRYRTPLIWGTLSLALGLIFGNLISYTLAPLPLPEPGTREDDMLLADLHRRIDNDFKVKVLRGKCLGVTKQLKGAEGGWVEIVRPPPAAAEETTTTTTIITPKQKGEEAGFVKQMQGARGLGVQRLFWNQHEHKLVAVVWFGPALSGWPGVTHGGVIATEFAEQLALVQRLTQKGGTTSSTAAATPQRMPGTGNHAKMFAPPPSSSSSDDAPPAQLSLSYVKPTLANNFYVIRIAPAIPLDRREPEHIVPSEPGGGHEWEATLETLDAKVTAKAKARFAPSSGRVQQRVVEEGEKVVQQARSGYAEFREWLWPSRQKALSS